MTRYISTRGEAPVLGFCDVMLTGLARDGGLYVPQTWPRLASEAIAGFFGRPYWEVAVDVMNQVTGYVFLAEETPDFIARNLVSHLRHYAASLKMALSR